MEIATDCMQNRIGLSALNRRLCMIVLHAALHDNRRLLSWHVYSDLSKINLKNFC